MRVCYELDLPTFEFWSGAAKNVAKLDSDQLSIIEDYLEDYFGTDTVTETDINDLFWFNFDTVLSWLGLKMTDDGDIVDIDYEEDEDEDFEDEDFEESFKINTSEACGSKKKSFRRKKK